MAGGGSTAPLFRARNGGLGRLPPASDCHSERLFGVDWGPLALQKPVVQV